MDKPLIFLSNDWLAVAEQIIQKKITPAMIHYANTSVLTIFENCPDKSEKALFVEIEKGMIVSLRIQPKPYPQAEFTLSGPYQTFLRVLKREIDPVATMMSGELTFHGNMMRALGMMPVLESLYSVLGEIPSDFEPKPT